MFMHFFAFILFIAKLLLGDVLKEGTSISLNPLVIWAWAGLLINGINSIPAGELDGGKIAFSIWGRKVTSDPNLNIPIFQKEKNLNSWFQMVYSGLHTAHECLLSAPGSICAVQ